MGDTKTKAHAWRLEDDMLALYLYKVELEKKVNLTQNDIDELATAFGIDSSEMRSRMEHYKRLDAKDDPGNVPAQAKEVWDAYWDLNAQSIMERLTGRR